MSLVVGVDPSLTSAGVAILRDGQLVHVSHHGHGGTSDASDVLRSRRRRKQEHDVTSAATSSGKPDLLMMERPLRVSIGYAYDRYTLAENILSFFDWKGVPVIYLHPTSAKLWLTGSGRADKKLIVSTVEGLFPGQRFACDDEADATGFALCGAFHLGDPMPPTFQVRPRHTLDKITWPVIA